MSSREGGAHLGGAELEIDGGEPLEVLLEEALRIVLPDLLPRHRFKTTASVGRRTKMDSELGVGEQSDRRGCEAADSSNLWPVEDQ